jgi:hypothetical protein
MNNCGLDKEYEACKNCDNEDNCLVEAEMLKGILKKLDPDEILFLYWMLAKAKGAGEWTVEEFAQSITDCMQKIKPL